MAKAAEKLDREHASRVGYKHERDETHSSTNSALRALTKNKL